MERLKTFALLTQEEEAREGKKLILYKEN